MSFSVFKYTLLYIINTPETHPKHAQNTIKNVFFFIINTDRGVLTGRRGVSSRFTNRRGTTEKPWNSGRRENEKARTPIHSTLRPPGSAHYSGVRIYLRRTGLKASRQMMRGGRSPSQPNRRFCTKNFLGGWGGVYPRDFPPSFTRAFGAHYLVRGRVRSWRILGATGTRPITAAYCSATGRTMAPANQTGTRGPVPLAQKNLCVHPSKFRPDRGANSARFTAFAARSMVPPGEPLGRGRTLPNLEPAPQVNQRKIFKKSLAELLTFRIYKYIFRYTRI